jgi:hypothetical protein
MITFMSTFQTTGHLAQAMADLEHHRNPVAGDPTRAAHFVTAERKTRARIMKGSPMCMAEVLIRH